MEFKHHFTNEKKGAITVSNVTKERFTKVTITATWDNEVFIKEKIGSVCMTSYDIYLKVDGYYINITKNQELIDYIYREMQTEDDKNRYAHIGNMDCPFYGFTTNYKVNFCD